MNDCGRYYGATIVGERPSTSAIKSALILEDPENCVREKDFPRAGGRIQRRFPSSFVDGGLPARRRGDWRRCLAPLLKVKPARGEEFRQTSGTARRSRRFTCS